MHENGHRPLGTITGRGTHSSRLCGPFSHSLALSIAIVLIDNLFFLFSSRLISINIHQEQQSLSLLDTNYIEKLILAHQLRETHCVTFFKVRTEDTWHEESFQNLEHGILTLRLGLHYKGLQDIPERIEEDYAPIPTHSRISIRHHQGR